MLESKREILPLTGLRGIAALLVVLAHYIGWYAPYQSRTEPQWFRAFFETDQLGMTLFFTLSGFVIAYNYLDMDWGGDRFRIHCRCAAVSGAVDGGAAADGPFARVRRTGGGTPGDREVLRLAS